MSQTDEMDNVADMQALARQQWEKRAQSLGVFNDQERGDVVSGKDGGS